MNSRPLSANSHHRQNSHRIASVKQYLANEKINPSHPLEYNGNKGRIIHDIQIELMNHSH